MKVLIIEDEPTAARRLTKILDNLAINIEVVATTDSISSTVKFLEKEAAGLDLILCDIHLADGLSFKIFEKAKVDCPIIFTTAYDQYAINAFKLNSIDYLLKPIKKEELEFSLRKLENWQKGKTFDYGELLDQLKHKGSEFPERIVVKYGQNYKPVDVSDIAFFYTENKIVFLLTFDKSKYAVDQNLEQLESILDPDSYFRINRQYIVNVKAIDRMVSLSKSRVKIYLAPPTEHEMVVSVDRSPHFKKWLAGIKS